MKIERVHHTRGVSRTELEEYFNEIGASENQGEYYGVGWQVILGEEQSCQLGAIVLPEVSVTFHGEDSIYNEMISAFRLKFLRAGG